MFRYLCKNLKWQLCFVIFVYFIYKWLECEYCLGYCVGFVFFFYVVNFGEEEFQSVLVVDKEVIVKY